MKPLPDRGEFNEPMTIPSDAETENPQPPVYHLPIALRR
jgi:hypothetical protein